MDVNSFRKILSSFKFFKPHIHLFGGEPFLHPDFPSFLKYCQIYNYRPTVTTNGDYLDKYSRLVIKSPLSQLNISVNNIVDYNGKINLNFEKKIKEFVNLNQKEKIINLNYAVEPKSYNYIEEVILYFNNNYKKGDFAYFVIQHFTFNRISEIKNPAFNLKRLINILNHIKKTNLKFKLIFLPNIKERDVENYYELKHPFRNKCYIPWLGLSIYPDLTIAPGGGVLGCNFLLGNLSETSIMDIWRGSELNSFRLKLISGGLPAICNRCCHKLYY